MVTVTGEPRLLSLREAAWRLDLHEETLRRMIRHGRVPAVRFGKRGWLKLRESDVRALIDGDRDARWRRLTLSGGIPALGTGRGTAPGTRPVVPRRRL